MLPARFGQSNSSEILGTDYMPDFYLIEIVGQCRELFEILLEFRAPALRILAGLSNH